MHNREIASICNCSHGSINAERKEMLNEEKEKEEQKQKVSFDNEEKAQILDEAKAQEEKTVEPLVLNQEAVFSMF